MFALEKNVPVPARQGKRGQPKFPLREMEVGDSFFVPFDGRPLQVRSVVSNAVAAFKLRNSDRDYRTAKQDDGVRVWRVA